MQNENKWMKAEQMLPDGRKNEILRWMLKQIDFRHQDDGEWGATELAEAAAEEFDKYEWLEDSEHWIWDASCIALDLRGQL